MNEPYPLTQFPFSSRGLVHTPIPPLSSPDLDYVGKIGLTNDRSYFTLNDYKLI